MHGNIRSVKNFIIVRTNPKKLETVKAFISQAYTIIETDMLDTIFAVSNREPQYNEVLSFPFCCGNRQDYNTNGTSHSGNGVIIDNHTDTGIQISTSLTGFPPVFLYRDSESTIISNEIKSISELTISKLHFNKLSILEIATIGHPLHYRTLFKEIELIPANSVVSVGKVNINFKRNRNMAFSNPFDSQDDFLEALCDSFEAACNRIVVDNTFIALTAGLDTRAIFSTLASQNKLTPAYTLSGESMSLDAKLASRLSKHYGIEHTIIKINSEISSKLPEYTQTANLYSGGLYSFEQMADVHLYQVAGTGFTARISGNLGNQVGRSGTEGTGIRNAPLHSLNRSITQNNPTKDYEHWFFEVNSTKNLLDPEFLITQESLFSHIGNYTLGHHFSDQQTPYADATLINLLYSQQKIQHENITSIKKLKIRDLKHRLFGQSPKHSFQCKAIIRSGGFAAKTPINWGWTAAGGFTAAGLFDGVKTLTDLTLGNKFSNSKNLTSILKLLHIKGLSGFHSSKLFYSKDMQSFIKEVFHDLKVRDSGVFDIKRLDFLCKHGIQNKEFYNESLLTLDLALAAINFDATI